MIHAKITPSIRDGLQHFLIEWVEVVDGQVQQVQATEEFRLSPDRPGCAYVSRVRFEHGEILPGTFWLDEQGKRHFYMSAEAGAYPLSGAATEMSKT